MTAQTAPEPGWMSDWYAGVPEPWCTWWPGRATETVDEIISVRADGPAAQDALRQAILAADAAMPLDRALLSAAAWVPDPTTGAIAATMLAELCILEDRRGAPVGLGKYLRIAHASPRRKWGRRHFEHEVTMVQLPVGPAVVERDIYADRRGPVTVCVQWTIFPDGTDEAIRFTITTPDRVLEDAVIEEGMIIAGSVTVTISPGRRT